MAPRIFEDGGQLRDFVHVSDVARANVLAITAGEPVSGPLNISSGSPHSILDLADAIRPPDGPAPDVVGGHRLGDVRHVFASPERAATTLGFRALVGFVEGTRSFADAPLRRPAGSAERRVDA
jgi:dTDP-L-rhamnose 4-epimerase